MKKIIAMVLALCMALTLFACGGDTPKETNEAPQPGQSTPADDRQESEGQKQTKPQAEEWGDECSVDIVDSKKTVRINISFPDYAGLESMTGLLCEQEEDTTAAFDVYREGNSPEVEDIQELFPAYSEQLMAMFLDFYGLHYGNNTLNVELDGTETIGDYEVTKFRGTHSYTLKKKDYNAQCVIYAVELKAGDYAYVMVQDDSKDQSQLDLIESHAYNMIRSMREE